MLLALVSASAIALCSCGSTGNTDLKNGAAMSETAAKDMSQAEAFDAMMLEFFQDSMSGNTLNTNFTVKYPENYGIKPEEATWGSVPLTEEDFAETRQEIQNYLDELHAIGRPEGSRAITYDIFEYEMTCSLEYYDNQYYYMENTLEPSYGLHGQIPTTMAEYHFDDVQDVEDYLTLLETFDEYVTDLMTFEADKASAGYGMCKSALEQSISECETYMKDTDTNLLIEVFPDKIAQVEGLTEEEIKTYTKRNEDAVKNDVMKAYQLMIDEMQSQLPDAPEDGAVCSYKNGQDYYRYQLKSSIGTDKTPEELIELTEEKMDSDVFTLAIIMQMNPDIFDLLETSDYPYTDPVEIIEHFKKTMTAELMPPCPEASYTLKEVHPSLRDTLSPAMYYIPRIDDTANNTIYTNIGGGGTANELMPTLAHEGYPGHMYQYVYYYNTRPNPVRSLFSYNGYVEGWAAYVENMSYDYCDFPKDVAQFQIAYNDFILNLYCRLDLGVHYEGWDKKETSDFVTQYLALDKAGVDELYEDTLFNPINSMAYGIGMDEINLLKEDMEALYDTEAETGENAKTTDSFDIVEFHKQFLDIGPAPFPLVRQYMFGE